MSHRRSPQSHRRLRLERCEERRVLSAASAVSFGYLANEDLVIQPASLTGWVAIDDATSLATFSPPTGGTRQTLFDSASLGFTANDAAARYAVTSLAPGLTVVSLPGLADRDASATPEGGAVLRPFVSTFVSAALTPDDNQILAGGTPVQDALSAAKDWLRLRDDNSVSLADLLAFRANQGGDQAGYLEGANNGWIDILIGSGVEYSGTATGYDDAFGSTSGLSNGASEESWESAGESSAADDPFFALTPDDDASDAFYAEAAADRDSGRSADERPLSPALMAPILRSRIAAAALERVEESPAPAAGEDAPGAGMIDLAALLIPAAEAADAPSMALAAASHADPAALPVQARDEALAVESWVRSLPAPSEPALATEGLLPATGVPAIGVLPKPPTPPQPTGAKPTDDHVSQAPPAGRAPSEAPEGPQKPSSEAMARRIDERSAGPYGYVTALLTSLLGGALVWANRRAGRPTASGCIELPRRETPGRP